MSKHTPGPWGVVQSKRTLIVAESGARVAACEDLSTADARLIAAAPELLDALRQIANHPHATAGIEEIARAALAKVEGK